MVSFTTIISFLPLALAITVTKPAKNEVWDSSKTNTISWTSVATDPQSVDIYLSHLSAWPPTNSLLFANVATSKNSVDVSGLQLPNGVAYRIDLVAHNKPEQIYAQSQQFNVTGEAVAGATSTLDGYTGPTYTPSASAGSSVTRTAGTTLTTSTATRSRNGTAAATDSSTSGSPDAQATLSTGSSTATAGAATTSGTGAAPTQSRSAAVGNVAASAPLAAVIFGAVAMFL